MGGWRWAAYAKRNPISNYQQRLELSLAFPSEKTKPPYYLLDTRNTFFPAFSQWGRVRVSFVMFFISLSF